MVFIYLPSSRDYRPRDDQRAESSPEGSPYFGVTIGPYYRSQMSLYDPRTHIITRQHPTITSYTVHPRPTIGPSHPFPDVNQGTMWVTVHWDSTDLHSISLSSYPRYGLSLHKSYRKLQSIWSREGYLDVLHQSFIEYLLNFFTMYFYISPFGLFYPSNPGSWSPPRKYNLTSHHS